MNKFFSPLLLCLLFMACQNTPKTASESQVAAPDTPEATAPVAPEDLQQASTNVTTGLKMMEDLRNQVDALPATVKKEKAAEIEILYSNLEGMMAKQSRMLNELKTVSEPASTDAATQESAAPEGISAAQLQEYNVSLAGYAKEAQAMQEAIEKLAGKKD